MTKRNTLTSLIAVALIFGVASVFLLPSTSKAAVTVSAHQVKSDVVAGTSHSMSITVTAGDQLVCFASNGAGTASAFAYNGVGMTTLQTSTAGPKTYALYLSNPASGAHNFTWTSSANDIQTMGCASISGMQATNPDGSGKDQSVSPTQPSATATTNNGYAVIWGSSSFNGGGSDQSFGNGCSLTDRLESLGGSHEAALGGKSYATSGVTTCDYNSGTTNNTSMIVLMAGAATVSASQEYNSILFGF